MTTGLYKARDGIISKETMRKLMGIDFLYDREVPEMFKYTKAVPVWGEMSGAQRYRAVADEYGASSAEARHVQAEEEKRKVNYWYKGRPGETVTVPPGTTITKPDFFAKFGPEGVDVKYKGTSVAGGMKQAFGEELLVKTPNGQEIWVKTNDAFRVEAGQTYTWDGTKLVGIPNADWDVGQVREAFNRKGTIKEEEVYPSLKGFREFVEKGLVPSKLFCDDDEKRMEIEMKMRMVYLAAVVEIATNVVQLQLVVCDSGAEDAKLMAAEQAGLGVKEFRESYEILLNPLGSLTKVAKKSDETSPDSTV